MTEWRDISNAPKDGTEILAYGHGHKILRWAGNTLEWFDGEYANLEPTHWMPLPDPPAAV